LARLRQPPLAQAGGGGKPSGPAAGERPAKKPGELTVEVRPVKVALIESGEALIDEGLKPGERVVVEGQYRLEDGSKVRVEDGSQPAKSPGASGRGTQRGTGGTTNRPPTNQSSKPAGG